MAKRIVRLTESEFQDLLMKSLVGSNNDMLSKILSSAEKNKNIDLDSSEDLNSPTSKKDGDKNKQDFKSQYNLTQDYYELDLNTREGYDAYKKIADNFISTRSSNLLGITGSMLADGARSAYNKHKRYVPVELALAQLAQEGGFTSNRNARPIKTKNPFNVGNVDSGGNIHHPSVQSGINRYYDLIAKNYLGQDKTLDDLLRNFVNISGNRYASDRTYERKIGSIVNNVRNNSEPIYASVRSKTSNLA